jgi:hypothetical protein
MKERSNGGKKNNFHRLGVNTVHVRFNRAGSIKKEGNFPQLWIAAEFSCFADISS